MRCPHLLLTAALALACTPASAAPRQMAPVPAQPQLSGLDAAEAGALIAKLEVAQRQLRAGQFQSFELLSGAAASAAMTKVAPRTASLQVPFRQVWNINRVPTDNKLWQPYRLAYAPNGLGQLDWDIEVVLGFEGAIERVLMIYKPPAPF